jgi:hypothetical protein
VRGPRATCRDYLPPRRRSDCRLSALLTDTLRLVRSSRSADRLKSKNPACEAVRREALAISLPRDEMAVIRHFQKRDALRVVRAGGAERTTNYPGRLSEERRSSRHRREQSRRSMPKRSVNQITLRRMSSELHWHVLVIGAARPYRGGPTMSEQSVEEGRSWTSDVVWVALYSIVVLLLMLMWVNVPA